MSNPIYNLSDFVQPSINTNAIQRFQTSTQYKENATLYNDGLLYKVLATYVSSDTSLINDLLVNKIKPLGIVRLTKAQRLAWITPSENTEVYQMDEGNGIWTYKNDSWINTNNISYLSATMSTIQNTDISNGNHLKFNTVLDKTGNRITLDTSSTYSSTNGSISIGRATLSANSTYEIKCIVPFIICANGSYGTINLYNADTGVKINNNAIWGSYNSNSNSFYDTLITSYTPTIDTKIEIRVMCNSGSISVIGDANLGYSVVTIQEINRTCNIDVVYNNNLYTEWTTYTPTITCSGSSFHLVNTYTMKGLYRTIGKTLQLKFIYNHNSNTGFNEGGSYNLPYQISIPSGFQIDVSKANLPSNLTSTSQNGAGGDALPLGHCTYFSSTAPICFPGKVVPLSSSVLGMHLIAEGTSKPYTLWGCGMSYYGGANVELTFTAEIPVL